MEVKRNGNNVNVYDGKKLILHLDKNNGIYTAVNDHVRVSARIEKLDEKRTKFSEVSLKKMNSKGKMVKNTAQKWIREYTSWLEYICEQYGLI